MVVAGPRTNGDIGVPPLLFSEVKSRRLAIMRTDFGLGLGGLARGGRKEKALLGRGERWSRG